MNLGDIFDKHTKKLLIIPLIITLIAIFFIYSEYQQNGDIINKDISLRGGISATVTTDKEIDINDLQSQLASEFKDAQVRRLSEFGSDEQIGIIIEVPETDENLFKSSIEEKLGIQLTEDNYSLEVVGSSLGESFYNQMLRAIIFTFALMAIVIVITYRAFIPSFFLIMLCALNIFVTIGILDLFNVRISTAGIGALLLLIGYSIDAEIVLTNKVLKRKDGSIIERFLNSFSTTLLMSLASLTAVIVGLIFSTSPVLEEIFTVMAIGLVVDMIFTNFMSAPLVIIYARMREKINAN